MIGGQETLTKTPRRIPADRRGKTKPGLVLAPDFCVQSGRSCGDVRAFIGLPPPYMVDVN